MQHLLVVLEALPLIGQTFNLLVFPELIRQIDDAKDQLHNNIGSCLLRNDVKLNRRIDSITYNKKNHRNDDVEYDVE